MDKCHRCGEPIETIKQFSIEHTENWLNSENPKELFFDVEKIAFSHLTCNVSHGKQSRNNNFSKYKGVGKAGGHKRNKSYRSEIRKEGKTYRLGYFATPEEAAQAYDAKALELFGPTATTNKSLGLL